MEEYERYTVKAVASKNPDEGYHTDDLDDAVGTAKAQAVSMKTPFKVIDNRKRRMVAVAKPDGSVEIMNTLKVREPIAENTILIDKDALKAMIFEAVKKKLEEGKGKPTDKSEKHDQVGKKHLKGDSKKKEDKKDIADAKKRFKEDVVTTPEGSRLGKSSKLEQEAMTGGVPGAMTPVGINESKVNASAADELYIFIKKNPAIWESVLKNSIVKKLSTTVLTESYNGTKDWFHLVNAAAKAYVQEHGKPSDSVSKIFNTETRAKLAEVLSREFEHLHKSKRNS
jgi:hypothetical protein